MATKSKMIPRNKKIVQWSASTLGAFRAIQKRAAALNGKLTDADFDAKGNPTGKMAKVIADLEAWAKKNKVKLETHEHVHGGDAGGTVPGGATPIAQHVCPATTTGTDVFDLQNGGKYTFDYTCTLKRKGLFGRCIYRCTSSGFSIT